MTSDMGPWNDYEFVAPKGARLKSVKGNASERNEESKISIDEEEYQAKVCDEMARIHEVY
jgi:hypothetical protein